jgi:hypothetical protein
MKHKKCFKCGEGKPLTEFYKHPSMPDGTVNKCKECNKLDVRRNRNDRLDYYQTYDRKRGNRQTNEYRKQYREKYPEKVKAASMVSNAVRDGRMTKPTHCQGCGGEGKIHGHHNDYSKPLDVFWLCVSCHKTVHVLEDFKND